MFAYKLAQRDSVNDAVSILFDARYTPEMYARDYHTGAYNTMLGDAIKTLQKAKITPYKFMEMYIERSGK